MIWAETTPEQKQAAVRQAVADDGLTYQQAADRLGTTRDSIAGVVERSLRKPNPIRSSSGKKNGSAPAAAGGKRDALTKAAGKARAKAKRPPRLNAFLRLPSELAIAPVPARSDVWAALAGSSPVVIAEHREGCRWPVGADLPFCYCNEAVTGDKVYCAVHAGIAYREPPPRKENGRRDSA